MQAIVSQEQADSPSRDPTLSVIDNCPGSIVRRLASGHQKKTKKQVSRNFSETTLFYSDPRQTIPNVSLSITVGSMSTAINCWVINNNSLKHSSTQCICWFTLNENKGSVDIQHMHPIQRQHRQGRRKWAVSLSYVATQPHSLLNVTRRHTKKSCIRRKDKNKSFKSSVTYRRQRYVYVSSLQQKNEILAS